MTADKHAGQPHRLCIQQHSGTLRARRHDFQGAKELITHSLEPFPEKANRCMCNGAKLSLNTLEKHTHKKENKVRSFGNKLTCTQDATDKEQSYQSKLQEHKKTPKKCGTHLPERVGKTRGKYKQPRTHLCLTTSG